MFKKKTEIIPEWIVAGLGNPGKKYEKTRHNAGFICIDEVAKTAGVKINKARFDSKTALVLLDGVPCLLMKPQTFMNASGGAVSQACDEYGIPAERVLVISDDVSFNVGSTRIRKSGSSGGQKGVNDIIEMLGTQDFPRIKVGAGKKPEGTAMVDWVLGDFTEEELVTMQEVAERVNSAVSEIVKGNIELAISRYNKIV